MSSLPSINIYSKQFKISFLIIIYRFPLPIFEFEKNHGLFFRFDTKYIIINFLFDLELLCWAYNLYIVKTVISNQFEGEHFVNKWSRLLKYEHIFDFPWMMMDDRWWMMIKPQPNRNLYSAWSHSRRNSLWDRQERDVDSIRRTEE